MKHQITLPIRTFPSSVRLKKNKTTICEISATDFSAETDLKMSFIILYHKISNFHYKKKHLQEFSPIVLHFVITYDAK